MKWIKIVTLVVVLTAALFSSLPRAACGQTDISVQESKKHFSKGVKLFKNDEYREALDEFRKSYDLRPHWGLLYNIGICYVKLGKKGKALTALLKFMEKGGSDISHGKAIEVEDFIPKLMKAVGIVRFSGDLSGARVLVDGDYYPDALQDMYIYIDPGKKFIRVMVGDKTMFEEKITIKKGEEININVGGVAVAPPDKIEVPIIPPILPVDKPDKVKPKKDNMKAMKTAAYAMAGLAGAFIIGYAAAGGVALDERNKMRDVEADWDQNRTSCGTPVECDSALAKALSDQDAHHDKAHDSMLAADILFAGAAATAVTAIGLLIAIKVKGKKEKKQVSPHVPSVGISPNSVSMTISF